MNVMQLTNMMSPHKVTLTYNFSMSTMMFAGMVLTYLGLVQMFIPLSPPRSGLYRHNIHLCDRVVRDQVVLDDFQEYLRDGCPIVD